MTAKTSSFSVCSGCVNAAARLLQVGVNSPRCCRWPHCRRQAATAAGAGNDDTFGHSRLATARRGLRPRSCGGSTADSPPPRREGATADAAQPQRVRDHGAEAHRQGPRDPVARSRGSATPVSGPVLARPRWRLLWPRQAGLEAALLSRTLSPEVAVWRSRVVYKPPHRCLPAPSARDAGAFRGRARQPRDAVRGDRDGAIAVRIPSTPQGAGGLLNCGLLCEALRAEVRGVRGESAGGVQLQGPGFCRRAWDGG